MGTFQDSVNGALSSVARAYVISKADRYQKEKVRIAQENLDLIKKRTAVSELNAQTAAKRAETAAYKAKTDRMQGKLASKAEMAKLANRAAEIKNETRDSKSAAKRAEAQLINANVGKSRESRLSDRNGKAKTVYDLQTPVEAPKTPVEASEPPAGTNMPKASGNASASPTEAPAAAVASKPTQKAQPVKLREVPDWVPARVLGSANIRKLQAEAAKEKKKLIDKKTGKMKSNLLPFYSVEERLQEMFHRGLFRRDEPGLGDLF